MNVRTANEFHDWVRVNLPRRLVIQDLDSWVLIISDASKNYEPLALVEEKRSSIPPEEWTPFRADIHNYMALYTLSVKAGLPMRIIYHTRELDRLAFFKVLSVDPASSEWIKYEKQVMTSEEFKRDFDELFKFVKLQDFF